VCIPLASAFQRQPIVVLNKAILQQKYVLRSSEVFLMPPEVVMPMSCSLCEPESRADGALAAQELNQLVNAVAGASANAVATARFPGFVQQH
jgi:hypothetical protein